MIKGRKCGTSVDYNKVKAAELLHVANDLFRFSPTIGVKQSFRTIDFHSDIPCLSPETSAGFTYYTVQIIPFYLT
jgi:hypothetical protein